MTAAFPPPRVTGGAGPYEMAAIMAVIEQLAAEEVAARATPTVRPRQSSWVLAWRPRQIPAPLPSHSYNAMPWAEVDQVEEINP